MDVDENICHEIKTAAAALNVFTFLSVMKLEEKGKKLKRRKS